MIADRVRVGSNLLIQYTYSIRYNPDNRLNRQDEGIQGWGAIVSPWLLERRYSNSYSTVAGFNLRGGARRRRSTVDQREIPVLLICG